MADNQETTVSYKSMSHNVVATFSCILVGLRYKR